MTHVEVCRNMLTNDIYIADKQTLDSAKDDTEDL